MLNKFIQREMAEIMSPLVFVTSPKALGTFVILCLVPYVVGMLFGAKETFLWPITGIDYKDMNIVVSLIFFGACIAIEATLMVFLAFGLMLDGGPFGKD